MTKRREPLTYHRALTTIAARIGWDRCAAICGVTERTVRYWSDPDCETEIRLLDAERLDRAYLEAGGDRAPFHQLFTLRLDIAGCRSGQLQSLSITAASSAKETGEAVAALVRASGAQNDPTLLRTARQEIVEAIETMQGGLAQIDQIEAEGARG